MAVNTDWAKRVARVNGTLSRSESAVLEFVTSQPQEAAFMSLKEMCDATSVSKPKVIDLYRKLGYDGFKEFRNGVQEFYRHHIDSYRASYTTFRQITSIEELSRTAVQVDSRSLARMSEHVNEGDLEYIAEAIWQAENLYVYGPGTGFYPAHFVVQRLKRYRVHVNLVQSDWQHLPEELYPIGSGDLFVLFHYQPESEMACRALEMAKEQGARSVVVSGAVVLDFVDLADRVIYVERGEMGFKNSMAVPMNFANLLLLAVELLGGEAVQERLKTLEDKRERYSLSRKS